MIRAPKSKSLRSGGSGLSKYAGGKLRLRCFLLGVLSAETFHAAGGVHQFLLASKEGMAIGADFYVDVALVGRAGGKAVAARAHNADFVVSGMYGCFHGLLTSVPNHSILKDGRRIQQMDLPHRGLEDFLNSVSQPNFVSQLFVAPDCGFSTAFNPLEHN